VSGVDVDGAAAVEGREPHMLLLMPRAARALALASLISAREAACVYNENKGLLRIRANLFNPKAASALASAIMYFCRKAACTACAGQEVCVFWYWWAKHKNISRRQRKALPTLVWKWWVVVYKSYLRAVSIKAVQKRVMGLL
jgi:hypothetical protein